MIALFLGTYEGKLILKEINKYTSSIYVSTATEYGGELLKEYKFGILNTNPLTKDEIEETFIKNNIEVVLDASHPYATVISKNLREITDKLKIKYIRYERPRALEKYKENEKVIWIKDYSEINNYMDLINSLDGNILNTTGSNNIKNIMELNISKRIIHRVLPGISSIEKCINAKVDMGDIIGIKGPISEEFNLSMIREYKIKAIILKDSGAQGGAEEKISAAIKEGVISFVIERKKDNSFSYDNIGESLLAVLENIKREE